MEGHEHFKLKHKGKVTSAVFSPVQSDRWVLTATIDGTIAIWDQSGKKLLEFQHSGSISSAIFSHDGKRILTSSADRTIKLWDIQGNLLADLNKHIDVVNSAVFSPDDRWILSASRDTTAKLWATPETISDWLKKTNSPMPLTEEEKKNWTSCKIL
jgi:WD40 repeat protein